MDRADLQLLAAVQADARLTAESLAERVGLSPSSVQKRLKRLRANGAIRREVAILDEAKLGGFMFFLVQLQMVGGRPRVLESTKDMARRESQVLQCFHVTGGADLVLLIATRNIEEFEAFSNRHFLENDDIARYDTSVVIRPVKTGFALPLGDADV